MKDGAIVANVVSTYCLTSYLYYTQRIMKHLLKHLATLLSVVVMVSAMSACSDDKDEPEPTLNERLVGTWVMTADEDTQISLILVFNKDQTGSLSTPPINSPSRFIFSQNFNWNTGTTANGFNYIEILKTGGDEILEDGKYELSLIGDALSFGGKRFVRG